MISQLSSTQSSHCTDYTTQEICTILGHYTVYSGNSLLIFRDKLLVPSSGLKTPEDGTNRLLQNVGKELPLHTV
jgi:hypothetical protein